MDNIDLINSLSGLLIFTSLLVIEAKTLRMSAIMYSVQSMVVVLIFLALAVTMDADQLYLWAASAFVTKALLVPYNLIRAEKNMEGQPPAHVNPWPSIGLAGVSLVVSFVVQTAGVDAQDAKGRTP